MSVSRVCETEKAPSWRLLERLRTQLPLVDYGIARRDLNKTRRLIDTINWISAKSMNNTKRSVSRSTTWLPKL